MGRKYQFPSGPLKYVQVGELNAEVPDDLLTLALLRLMLEAGKDGASAEHGRQQR